MKGKIEQQEAACKMIVLLIGDQAQDWITYLWDNIEPPHSETSETLEPASKPSPYLKIGDMSISPGLLSYLTANCMDQAAGAKYVIRFIEEEQNRSGVGDLDLNAYIHLKYFDAEQIIPWVEANLGTRSDWWGRLFISVKPAWETFLRWSKLESKYRSALVEGLYYLVSDANIASDANKNYKIDGLPPKEEFRLFLGELKEGQLLSTKKRKIDEVLKAIDSFY